MSVLAVVIIVGAYLIVMVSPTEDKLGFRDTHALISSSIPVLLLLLFYYFEV